jgi:hypothetical protein
MSLNIWNRVNEELAAQSDKLDAFLEYVQCFFIDALHTICQEKGWREPGYFHRPPLGLRLECDNDMTLAVRPAWRKPKALPGHREGWGAVRTEVVEVEVLKRGVVLSVRLTEGRPPRARTVTRDDVDRRRALDALRDKTHDLLVDPWALFSEQADNCSCCGRAITDIVSKTRGIGPECIRLFAAFKIAPPTKVEIYRQAYLQETGFLPGR